MREVIVRTSFNGYETVQNWRDGKPVEFIVRCKDCRRGKYREHDGYEPEVYCKKWDAIMNEDGFCSCGVRRAE